jgi:hypothetical protein
MRQIGSQMRQIGSQTRQHQFKCKAFSKAVKGLFFALLRSINDMSDLVNEYEPGKVNILKFC